MNKYTEIEYQEVSQITRSKMAFSKVRFADLESVVRFTARTEEKTDPLATEDEIDDIKAENMQFYQRIINDSRTYGIQQFIIGEAIKEYKFKGGLSKIPSLGLFPTSTLIAINSYPAETIEQYENEYYNLEKESDNQITLCFVKENKIYLPKDNEVALIVDGQHRIAALRDLYTKINENLKFGRKKVTDYVDSSFFPFLKDRINNFEFLCTILFDFNIYEQGEIFASVNFNQKPVNRSLYYDIFGSSPNTERNELKFSHDLVSHLNYSVNSDLNGLIDMIGNGDGIVSQSAMMENLMKLFGRNKCWNLLYMDYRNHGDKHKAIPLFLKLYFKQIKESFIEYWPETGIKSRKDYKFVLVKTTGMGAFLKLINDIYPIVNQNHAKSKEEIQKELKVIFSKIEGNKHEYFDNDSPFVKGAGQGLQSKLYKKILSDLGFRASL
jgi:DGQHR domain-containing protein